MRNPDTSSLRPAALLAAVVLLAARPGLSQVPEDQHEPDWAAPPASQPSPPEATPVEPEGDGEGEGEGEDLLLGGGDDGAGGDDDGEEISFEDPLVGYVVVTGAKRRKRTQASLATISVITNEDARALPYLYLGDLLSLLPGVDARWGMMQRYYVGIRGLGSTTALNSRLLLLWDGVPMNDPFTGELSAGHFIPLVDVQRIEVIRGAGSTMYGANAFSGVVNVVTVDPADLVPREGVRANALMGSFLTSRMQVAVDETVGRAHVGGSVEGFRTDGPFPHIERSTPTGFSEFKNDDVQSVAAEAHVVYGGLQVRGQFVAGDRGRPGTFITDSTGHMRECANCHSPSESGQGLKYPATTHSCGNCHAAPLDRETTQRGTVALIFNRWIGNGFTLGAQAYHNEFRTDYLVMREDDFLQLIREDVKLDQRASGAEIHLAHSTARNNLVFGTEVRRTEAASQLILAPGHESSASLANVAGFVEDELEPAKWIELTAGARVDYSTLFGVAVTPRGGVLLKPTERLSLRVAGAQAFRNPSLSELYVNERRGRYAVHGNPDLIPEWITSLEVGVRYAFQPRDRLLARLGGVGYWNRTVDLIGIHSDSRETATFANAEGVADIQGAEAEAQVEVKGKPRLQGSANVSYQRAVDHDGRQMPYAPTLKGNITLSAGSGRWRVLVRSRLIGERDDEMGAHIHAFATLDASAQIDVGRGMFVQLWANNLFDDQSQESLGIPRAARSFFVTVGYLQDE